MKPILFAFSSEESKNAYSNLVRFLSELGYFTKTTLLQNGELENVEKGKYDLVFFDFAHQKVQCNSPKFFNLQAFETNGDVREEIASRC